MSLDKKAIINQIDYILDQSSEFIDAKSKIPLEFSDEDYIKEVEISTLLAATIDRLAPPGSRYRKNAHDALKRFNDNTLKIDNLIGILKALKVDYEAGHLEAIHELIHADVFADFLEMAYYLLEEGYIDDIKQNLLAKKVLEINLSGIEGVSYSDILDFRDDNKKELKSFRIEMGKMSTSISSNPWTSEFDSELAQIVKSKIEPKVQDLENQTSEFKDNMIVKYGKKAIPVAITLGATVYAGVPLSLAVVGTTLFDKFVKGDDNIIGSILNDWKDWRHQSRNSLTYLMNLNRLNS